MIGAVHQNLLCKVHIYMGGFDKIDSLENQIAEGNDVTEELKEYRIYMQTMQFIEDIAKKVLGLIEPGEMVVVPNE